MADSAIALCIDGPPLTSQWSGIRSSVPSNKAKLSGLGIGGVDRVGISPNERPPSYIKSILPHLFCSLKSPSVKAARASSPFISWHMNNAFCQ